MTKALITQTNRDAQGNVGDIKALGSRPTVEEAKSYAMDIGAMHHPNGSLHWKEFSPTTWGLMAGQVYTNILVSKIA